MPNVRLILLRCLGPVEFVESVSANRILPLVSVSSLHKGLRPRSRSLRRIPLDLNQSCFMVEEPFAKVNFLALGIDLMSRMAPIPVSMCCRTIHVLDDFSPTATVVGAKANFSLLGRHWRTRIGKGRKIVIKPAREPQAVNNHDFPTPFV